MVIGIMILIGFSLVFFNLRGIKKENNSFNAILEKEKVNNNRDYDKEIILIRKDLAETVMDLQKEIEEIKAKITRMNNVDSNYLKVNHKDNNKEEIFNNDELESHKYIKESVISKIDFSNKIQQYDKVEDKEKIKIDDNKSTDKITKVKILIENGLTDDEICSELSIGKGEVLLIKGLLK